MFFAKRFQTCVFVLDKEWTLLLKECRALPIGKGSPGESGWSSEEKEEPGSSGTPPNSVQGGYPGHVDPGSGNPGGMCGNLGYPAPPGLGGNPPEPGGKPPGPDGLCPGLLDPDPDPGYGLPKNLGSGSGSGSDSGVVRMSSAAVVLFPVSLVPVSVSFLPGDDCCILLVRNVPVSVSMESSQGHLASKGPWPSVTKRVFCVTTQNPGRNHIPR